MSRIIGNTVGTPISPEKIEREINPVKTVNGIAPDTNGNVTVGGGSGAQGENGATFTPSVSSAGVLSWTNDKGLNNPTPVNIKGADGKDGTDGKDGADGTNGTDGVSPTISVSSITGGYRITTTDKNGTKYVDIMDGADGKDGTNGVNGKTPYIQNGYWYIDGANTNVKAQGVDGKDGTNGINGTNGKDGADGKTPVRGTDYWTEADKAEIKSYIDEAILGGVW